MFRTLARWATLDTGFRDTTPLVGTRVPLRCLVGVAKVFIVGFQPWTAASPVTAVSRLDEPALGFRIAPA